MLETQTPNTMSGMPGAESEEAKAKKTTSENAAGTEIPVEDGTKTADAGVEIPIEDATEDGTEILVEDGTKADGTESTAEDGANADGASGENAVETESAESGSGQEADDSEEAAGSGEEKLDEGFFTKKKKKDKKDEQIEELTDRVKRQMAEFDNFRKRTEKEKSQMFDAGAKHILEKILPVVDNFERGLAAVAEEEKENPIAQGMEQIYKQLMTTLEEAGVNPIEAAGAEFDPNLHNAVMHIDDDSFGENIVAEEFQKGYTYHDNVIRHSMVKVAN